MDTIDPMLTALTEDYDTDEETLLGDREHRAQNETAAPTRTVDTVASTSTTSAQKTTRKGGRQKEISPRDQELMSFIGKFPGATTEALSMLQYAEESGLPNRASGGLRSEKGVAESIRKLRKLGVVAWHREPGSGLRYHSLTADGIQAMGAFGEDTSAFDTLEGKARTRASHYSAVAHVAAQLHSPHGYFTDALDVPPVSLEALISELEMRHAFGPVRTQLKAASATGSGGDFGEHRLQVATAVSEKVQSGALEMDDLMDVAPVLWTLGEPQWEDTKAKAVHQPDLAVRLGTGADGRSRNLLVEVEISKKSWDDYVAILATLAAELEHNMVYGRAVYFCVGSQVPTLLRKADRVGQHGLFASGKLVTLPLTHRDGSPFQPKSRIRIA